MIKINLALRKQSASAASAASEARGSAIGGLQLPAGLSKLNLDVNSLKGPMRKLLPPILVGLVATFVVDGLKEEELAKVQEESATVAEQRNQLMAAAEKIKGYEAVKKSLEADEQLMRIKIDVVQQLIADRTNPPKLLRSLSTSIPKDVWLSEFKAGAEGVTLKGYSLDFNQVSDFMKSLSESVYFADLAITGTQQAKDEFGMDVASFELTAKRR